MRHVFRTAIRGHEFGLAVLLVMLAVLGLHCSARGEEQAAQAVDPPSQSAVDKASPASDRPLTHSEAMTILHNNYRVAVGLPPQAVDGTLSSQAQAWAEAMASADSMYHGPHDQIVCWASDGTYETAFREWQTSPPHRVWLCNGGARCGFGYAISRSGLAYYAGVFDGAAGGGGESVASEGGYRGRFAGRVRFFRRR